MSNVNLSDAQAGRDFASLKAVLHEAYASTDTPKVIGPDTGGCSDKKGGTMAKVLSGKPPLDVVTFHHCESSAAPFASTCEPENRRRTDALAGGNWAGPPNHPRGWKWTVEDVVAAALSNVTETDVKGYVDAMRQAGLLGSVPLWLGEGATTYSQPLDQSFATLYNYLNILKQTGLNGVQVFAKQSLPDFFGNDGQPTPVYYFAVLWKRLMGQSVYRATSPVETLVLAARSRKQQEPAVAGGGFVVAAANLGAEPATLALRGTNCKLFLLTPVTDPSGVGTKLNGKELSVDGEDGTLPPMEGEAANCGQVRLAPMAVGFIVVA